MVLSAHTAQILRQLNYLLSLPDGYEQDTQKRWPLIMFLHGAGERGDDLEKLKVNGIPKVVAQGVKLPFVTVSPQCPLTSSWPGEVSVLGGLLDDILARYRVDPTRVYLTGLSMGGYGTWAWAVDQPTRFAAIAPICGGYGSVVRRVVWSLKGMPLWVFHGGKDEAVPVQESIRLVEALRAAGAGEELRFTLYPEANHDSWTESYNNPALYEWFLQHQRRPEAAARG